MIKSIKHKKLVVIDNAYHFDTIILKSRKFR